MSRICLKDGILAGAIAGAAGGLPSMVVLRRGEVAASVRSMAHLVPGGSGIESQKARWAMGAGAHMALSMTFGVIYACFIRRMALAYAAALWFFNYKLLAPKAMRSEDRSLALADHLFWGLLLSLSLRALGQAGRRPT